MLWHQRLGSLTSVSQRTGLMPSMGRIGRASNTSPPGLDGRGLIMMPPVSAMAQKDKVIWYVDTNYDGEDKHKLQVVSLHFQYKIIKITSQGAVDELKVFG